MTDHRPFALRPLELTAEEGAELERRLTNPQPHPTWKGQDLPLHTQLFDRTRLLDRLYLAADTAEEVWLHAMQAGSYHAPSLYDAYVQAKAAYVALRDSPLPDGEEPEQP